MEYYFSTLKTKYQEKDIGKQTVLNEIKEFKLEMKEILGIDITKKMEPISYEDRELYEKIAKEATNYRNYMRENNVYVFYSKDAKKRGLLSTDKQEEYSNILSRIENVKFYAEHKNAPINVLKKELNDCINQLIEDFEINISNFKQKLGQTKKIVA